MSVMRPTFVKWLTASLTLGLLVPIAFLLAQEIVVVHMGWTSVTYPLHRLMRLLWPSSVWLMATVGIERAPIGYLFVLISVLANVVLYGAVGAVLWVAYRSIKRDTVF